MEKFRFSSTDQVNNERGMQLFWRHWNEDKDVNEENIKYVDHL